MNTFVMKLGALVGLLLLVLPTGAHAYRFVDSSALRLSDTTYMLTHTYTAGFLNEDSLTPIVATTDMEAGIYPRVAFSINGLSSEALASAEVNSLVLSDAAIVENQYQTIAGSRNTFTLFTLVTLASPAPAASNVSLAMRSLPFSYTQDGEEKTGEYTIENTASTVAATPTPTPTPTQSPTQTEELTLTTGK